MYRRDVNKIRKQVEEGTPKDLVATITFVLLTIRVPFSRVKGQAIDVKQNMSGASSLWGFKRKGYQVATSKSDSLYRTIVDKRPDVDSVLYELLSVPGLGLAKASFAAQCLGYNTACLDTHNLKRLGIPESITKAKTNKAKSIRDYLDVVQVKGTEWYWDSWCDYLVGTRHNSSLTDSDMVSAYHYECIKILGDNNGT